MSKSKYIVEIIIDMFQAGLNKYDIIDYIELYLTEKELEEFEDLLSEE